MLAPRKLGTELETETVTVTVTEKSYDHITLDLL